MLRNPRTSRTPALVVTVALAAAGLSFLVGGPADAASGALTYHCTTDNVLVPTADLSAVVDTNAPATLGAGVSTPITVTYDVTVPDAVADLFPANVTSLRGSSVAVGTVDGVQRSSTLTIPSTPVPADGDFHVVGTGPGGSITGGAVGSTILLGAGDFTAKLTGYDTAGNVVVPETTFTCALTPAGQNLLVDSVTVVQTPTTTTLTVTSPVEYGATATVSADVALTGSNAKPAGKIAFSYAGKTVTVDVKGGKAKADVGPALTMGKNIVTAVFTPTDTTQAPSQAAAAFTVVRGSTTTTATVAYRDVRNRMVGKAQVASVNGTDVAGKVKFVLKRNGTRIRTAIVDLNLKDKAKKVFDRISKPGTYVVVAKYLGSPTLKRSTGRIKITI